MLTPLVSALGLVGLVVLFALFARGARRSAAFVVPFLGLLALPGPADALERRVARSPHEEVLLRADETLDDSLLAVGETVAIDGTVTGNLIACAQRVIVRGRVMGDLVVAGQRVDLAGTVDGNVAGFAQILVVRGPVGKSLHTFGEHVTLDREGRVDGDVVSFAGGLDLEGRMGRDLLAFGGFVNLRGEVLRHVTSWTERLRVDAPAKVGGDLVAHTADAAKVSIDPGAAISGKTETKVETKHHKSRYARPSFYVWKLIWLAAAFLAGLLVHRFFPVLLATTPSGLALGRALGFGFVALVAAPVALVVLGLTMVGLPLALAGFAVWLFALYLSSIVVGALVGHALLGRAEGKAASFPAALLVGLVTVTVAAHLPVVGFLLGLFVTVLGLGITVLQARRGLRAQAA
jgi:cytoskeletal protein CcmA (bactofilin family)